MHLTPNQRKIFFVSTFVLVVFSGVVLRLDWYRAMVFIVLTISLLLLVHVFLLQADLQARGWQKYAKTSWLWSIGFVFTSMIALVFARLNLSWLGYVLLAELLCLCWFWGNLVVVHHKFLRKLFLDNVVKLPRVFKSLTSRLQKVQTARKEARAAQAAADAIPFAKRRYLAVEAELDVLVAQVKKNPKTNQAINKKVLAVRNIILEALPQDDDVMQYDVHTLNQIAEDYFPQTIEFFLKTDTQPTLFKRQIVQDGKTAEILFLEQLEIIEQAVKDLLSRVHEDATQDLIANGRFLRERFRKSDF